MPLLGADWLIPPSPLSPYLHFENGERPRGFSARIRVIRDSFLSIRYSCNSWIRGCSLLGCGRRPLQVLCALCVLFFVVARYAKNLCGRRRFGSLVVQRARRKELGSSTPALSGEASRPLLL